MRGNAIIGQSGGPTAVINSSLSGLVRGALASRNIDRVFGMRYGIEGFMKEEIIDLGKESPEILEGLGRTPSSALGSCRYKLKDADFPLILSLFKKYGVRYYFLIGGNDTMDTIHRVEKYCASQGYGLIGVGVPKTVDNDLYGTDHTPGFASAARYVALSVKQAGRLACDMQKVDPFVIQQTVGREAGWLAASSALARQRPGDAPHLIYIPERPLNKDRVIADVRACVEKLGWCSIVCGEGILWENGRPVSESQGTDKFANVEFGAMGGSSAAINLHAIIKEATGLRGEFQITESLPMCAMDRASALDIEEAHECGLQAVKLADSGTSGVMVMMRRLSSKPYRIAYETIQLEKVAVNAKPMPDEYISASGTDVTEAFLEYLRPLVGDLEQYTVLSNFPVG